MATTTIETVVVAEELKALLDTVEGLRAYWFVSDLTRVPTNGGAAVIGQPDIDFMDQSSGFCQATWTFPISLIVARGSEREAQTLTSRLLMEIVAALATEVPGIFSIQPVDARPITVSIGQQEMPGYLVNVRVRA